MVEDDLVWLRTQNSPTPTPKCSINKKADIISIISIIRGYSSIIFPKGHKLYKYTMCMAEFTCDRCTAVFSRKAHLVRHLQRKTPCNPTASDVDVDILLSNHAKPLGNFICEHCNKSFTQNCNRYRHQKICQQKHTNVQQQNTKTPTSTTYVNNNIVNNNIFNNTLNIIINIKSFGEESLDHITNEFIEKCMRSKFEGLKELVQQIHFSSEAPDNRNVRLKSLKNNLLEVVEGNRWVIKDKNDVVDRMIHKSSNIIGECFRKTYPLDMIMDAEREHQVYEDMMSIQSCLSLVCKRSSEEYYKLRRKIHAFIIEITRYNQENDTTSVVSN